MSVIEAKKEEITRILDRVPESVIDKLLEYLHKVESQEVMDFNFMQALEKIMTEDHELLKRLAQ